MRLVQTDRADGMAKTDNGSPERTAAGGTVGEVFRAFLKLGLTSFGGPVAHLGYFRREFVERRKWVGESQFAQLLALCQFLPGPASSQLGFSLGLLRAGWAGGLAAFAGFTLPSAALLFGFAIAMPHMAGGAGEAAMHGLKLVALAVVAQGVWGMARRLCPDAVRMAIAAVAAGAIVLAERAWMQLVVVAVGALAGLAWCRGVESLHGVAIVPRHRVRSGWGLLALFVLLLAGLSFGERGSGLLAVAAGFYRAGALVFGGGHVVLPLLQETVVRPGWISSGDFMAGYGAAQAVPGPMFSLAAYLGARLPGSQGGLPGATVALAMIFLPGLLLVAGVLPLWSNVASRPSAARAIAGVNAAVVGLLAAALYNPVWTSAVREPVDVAIGLVGFAQLVAWRLSPLWVVAWCVVAAIAGARWS
jgi:chromate transporter